MSLFQLSAVVDGWAKANGDGRPAAPSEADFDAMVAMSVAASAAS